MNLEEIDKKWTNSRIREWAFVRDSARDGTELDTYHILPCSFDEKDQKDLECFLMYLPKLIAVAKAAKNLLEERDHREPGDNYIYGDLRFSLKRLEENDDES